MPVTSLIRDLMYELDKRQEEHEELTTNPLINPDWLLRSKSEMKAISECVMILIKVKSAWKSKGPMRKMLKTPIIK